ncbi:MAG: linear amide C-N hydrolase [Ruminococcus sp.]|nr:linear amide C-N hydrolase [Ruminococcus sp.]
MKDERKVMKEAVNKTLSSIKPINKHFCIMDYHVDYNLKGMLAEGGNTVLSEVRYLQKHIHSPKLLPNPLAGPGGCSTFNAVTPEGQIIMGRNFDYRMAKCMAMWTHPKEGYRSLAMVNQNHLIYADIRRSRRPLRALGAPYLSMDGINEKGLCAAILMLITKPTHQNNGKPPITVNVALRAVLDTCATADEAVELLQRHEMHDLLGACYHYQFTDAAGVSNIVEYVDGKMYVYRQADQGYNLKLTNFFLTPSGKCREKGRDRFERMDCALKKNNIMTEQEAMKLLEECKVYFLSKYKIYHIGTLWSSVYNCTERTMLISTGLDYSRQYKLAVDKPMKIVKVK